MTRTKSPPTVYPPFYSAASTCYQEGAPTCPTTCLQVPGGARPSGFRGSPGVGQLAAGVGMFPLWFTRANSGGCLSPSRAMYRYGQS